MEPLRLPISPSGRLAQAGGVEDRYRLGAELARGGMGVVFLARDEILGRDVALKVLLASPEYRLDLVRRFIRESKIAAQLQHPGIPSVYELGWLCDGRPFLAMKLIHGKMLSELLATGAADRATLLAAFEQLCQTVAYAHAQNIVHRDLKPANVMIGPYGEVQLVDWGLARGLGEPPTSEEEFPDSPSPSPTLAGGISPHSQVTEPNQFLGTPNYMAPERMRGEVGDRRSDVYSLGALLHEILTGRPPVWSDRLTLSRLIPGGTGMEPLQASGADPMLVELATRCLSADPQRRPADASELAQTMLLYRTRAAEQLRQLEHENTARRVRAEEGKRRKRLLRIGAGFAAVLLLSLGGLVWVQLQKQAEERQRAREFLVEIRQRTEDAQRRRDWAQVIALLKPALPQFSQHDPSGTALRQAQEDLETAYLVQDLERLRRQGRLVSTRERFVRISPEEIAESFKKHGWDVSEQSPETIARMLDNHPAREELINGFYAWRSLELDTELGLKLRDVLILADRDPWRLAVLKVFQKDSGQELLRLIAELPDTPQPPELMVYVARAIDQVAPGEGLRFRQRLQERFPGEFWYNLDLATYLSEMPDRRRDALTYAQIAVALRPEEAIAWNMLGLAQILMLETRAALSSLERAVRLWPDRGALRVNYALALAYNRKLEQAQAELDRGIQLAPGLLEADYVGGLLALFQDDEPKARAAFRRVWAASPPRSWYMRDSMLFLVDDLLTPQEVQRELQARPSAGLYFAQSRHLLRQRKVAAADEALVKALQLAPWDKFLMIESIRVAEALDNPAQLMDRVSQLLLQEPGEIRTVLNLRLFSNYSQPIPGLKALAHRVYVRFPERAEGWILRALDELQNGRLDPAKEACQMALRCAESQASARLLQGVTLEHMGRSEAAQTAYFLSHALDPSDPRPLIGIASVWLQRGNPNLAEATFRELARLGAAPQHVVRGQTEVLLAKGRTLAAIRYLESQLDAFPDELELISLRGMLAWQVGRPADAEIWFQKVLSRDPRHLVARINLGQIQLSQRKVTQGLATLKEALAIAPNDPTLLQVYGVALLRNGQLAEAESILLRASEVQPNEPRVIAALGSMYLESNRLKEAHTLLSRITEIHPQNPQLRLVYGQTLLRMHRYTEAVNQMERAQRMISSDSPNYAPVAMQLNLARQFVKMERRLDDVLAGTIKPSITETIDLIEMYAHAKQKPVDAAEWAVRFLLANERHRFGPGQNVYLRAGVLALQASRATEQTDPAQSHRWRRQALSYLDRQRRQWIEAVNEKAASAESLQANRKRLNTMPELRNVRDPAEQKKLPSDEAAAWKKLFDWANETPPREVLPSF